MNTQDNVIIGAKGGGGKGGGGGGSQRTPVESPDSLRSRAYARIIDLICEGEIEGLATGDLKSVYLDQTPIQNDDGTFNFTGVNSTFRNGTQNQAYIPGFSSVESENSVNVRVQNGSPVVRTINGAQYTMARVTIAIPQMTDVNTANGDTNGSSVRIRIEVQPNGGSYTTVVEQTITGKTTTKYQRSFTFPLTGTAPFNIRVTRLTPDSTRATLQNQTWWESYTEIVEAKLRYPNSALMALEVDSQQFANIPRRGYKVKLLRVKVPSNYNAATRTYTGSWDGTFQIAWTDNPAWCFYDLITNSRYGLGDFIDEAQVDKWGLYQIGRYCDELVPDGYGGQEPRFTCNIYIQTQQEAFRVVQDMASIFRGMVYWSSGLITAAQDAPADAVALFSKANVIDGMFNYSGSSLKTRHTVALVSWNDPDDYYALKPEYVEDAEGIARYGIIPTQIVAVGCTSRGQAHRVGRWLLYSESKETETVTFKTGLEGTVVRPGQVINVQDADRVGLRLSGRVMAATTLELTVDSGFTMSPGVTYTAYVMMADGSVGSAQVQSVSGNIITLATPLPSTPQANAVWAVQSSQVALQQFRVVSVVDGNDGTYEITGLAYNVSKYNYVENNLVLTENPISLLNTPPDAPQNITISEALYQTSGTVQTRVTIAWDQVARADSYIVAWQRDDLNEVVVSGVRNQLYEIELAQPGLYRVSVYAVSVNGKRSPAGTNQRQILGKTSKPADVSDFSLAGISNGVAQLTWSQAPDLDVIVGGYVRIRYTPDTVTPSWVNSVDIGPALPGSATTASVPHVNGVYLAKFVDSSGLSSENAVQVATTTASLVNLNVVGTIDESTFPGTKNGTNYNAGLGGLVIDGAAYLDDWPLIDDIPFIDSYGGFLASGEYLFAAPFSLGAVYPCLVTASIAASAYDVTGLIDSIADWDALSGIDGAVVDDVNATLYVRTSDDNGATWSTWRPFFVGQYIASDFEFKLVLTSLNPEHNIAVTALTVTIDMPDRVEAGRNITSGAGAYTVTYPAAFRVPPAVGITASNMASGDYFVLSGQTETGFTVTFKNSAGTNISRNFDYIAKGYGFRQ